MGDVNLWQRSATSGAEEPKSMEGSADGIRDAGRVQDKTSSTVAASRTDRSCRQENWRDTLEFRAVRLGAMAVAIGGVAPDSSAAFVSKRQSATAVLSASAQQFVEVTGRHRIAAGCRRLRDAEPQGGKVGDAA